MILRPSQLPKGRVRTVGEVDAATRRKLSLQRAGLKRMLRRRTDPEYDAKLREYCREYTKRNAEKIKKRRDAWVAANRERLNAYQRRQYEMNPARREYLARKYREYRAVERQS
jgi:hypothetical protein